MPTNQEIKRVRGEVLNRVMAGEITFPQACDELRALPATLYLWAHKHGFVHRNINQKGICGADSSTTPAVRAAPPPSPAPSPTPPPPERIKPDTTSHSASSEMPDERGFPEKPVEDWVLDVMGGVVKVDWEGIFITISRMRRALGEDDVDERKELLSTYLDLKLRSGTTSQ